MTDRELMQQALDWADEHLRVIYGMGGATTVSRMTEWTAAFRARLAQPEPDDGYCQACEGNHCTAKNGCVARDNPPPQREWQGLTDEEVIKLGRLDKDSDYFGLWYDFAQAIEAKLKEKNCG